MYYKLKIYISFLKQDIQTSIIYHELKNFIPFNTCKLFIRLII